MFHTASVWGSSLNRESDINFSYHISCHVPYLSSWARPSGASVLGSRRKEAILELTMHGLELSHSFLGPSRSHWFQIVYSVTTRSYKGSTGETNGPL